MTTDKYTWQFDSYVCKKILSQLSISTQMRAKMVDHQWNDVIGEIKVNTLFLRSPIIGLTTMSNSIFYCLDTELVKLDDMIEINKIIRTNNPEIIMTYGAFYGDINMVKHAIKIYGTPRITTYEHNRNTSIGFLIEYGFLLACYNGQFKLVEYMLRNYHLDEDKMILSSGLLNACYHRNIKNCKYSGSLNDYVNIIKLLSNYGTNITDQFIAFTAQHFSEGHIIPTTLINASHYDINTKLALMCQHNCYKGIMELLEARLPTQPTNLNVVFKWACSFGNLGFVKWIVNKFGGISITMLNEGLICACRDDNNNYLELVKYLVELGANDKNGAFLEACKNGVHKIAKILVNCGANNFDECLGICIGQFNSIDVKASHKRRYEKIIHMIKTKGNYK